MQRWILFPDLQVPFHDRKALAVAEKYMKAHRWDGVVHMGDFMDLDQLSRWSIGEPDKLANRVLANDYVIGNAILDRHEKIAFKKNPDATLVFLEGNHDERAERFVAKNPQLKGLIEVNNGLRLKERGWKYVKCYSKGDMYKIGKLHLHHGLYCGINHARKHALKFGVNIAVGHVHDIASASLMQWGRGKVIQAHALGCLCKMNQGYIKKNPSNWSHAITTVFVQDSGMYNLYTSRIFNGKMVGPDGREYLA